MPKRTKDYREGLLRELRDCSAAAHYLNAALEDSDEMFLRALRDVAEAKKGIAKTAESAELSRESLYRMLSVKGNPTFNNLLRILRTLGLQLTIQPEDRNANEAETGARTHTVPEVTTRFITEPWMVPRLPIADRQLYDA